MSENTPIDIEFIRAQFPAFAQHNLADQAFFENAGGSYTCQQVIDRLMRYYKQRKVQPYGAFAASIEAGNEMDEARTGLAALMGVEPNSLSFGPSSTQNTYILAQAFGQYLNSGDCIIVTDQDHEANTGPWRRLAERGIEIREWKLDPQSGQLNPDDLALLLDERVKLVCFPHCSNIVGEINDVASLCAMIRDRGAFSCVDGVSYAPHGLPNVAELGADIYLFSSYKTYGPHQGIMIIRPKLGMELPNQGHYFNAGSPYKRFTPAGPDHAQIAACAGIVDYIDLLYKHHHAQNDGASATERAKAVHDLMRAHETALLQPLLEYLAQKNSVRLLGPKDATRKAPTVAVVGERPGFEIAQDLARHGIMAGGGDFYGLRCLQAQGVDPDFGALRLSFVHYTKRSEVDRLITALEQVL